MSKFTPGLRVPNFPPLSPLDRLYILLGTGLGFGFLKPFSATWGSLPGFALTFWLLTWKSVPLLFGVGIFLTLVGIPIADRVARLAGQKDPSCVVIDEIACVPFALWPTLYLAPLTPWQWALVFVIYRVADGLKPFPANRLEALPGGFGIMLDDVVSSLYMSGAWFAALTLWK